MNTNESTVAIGANFSELLTAVDVTTQDTAQATMELEQAAPSQVTEDQVLLAIHHVRTDNIADITVLQHRMGVTPAVAAELLNAMENHGVVGPGTSASSTRDILPLIHHEDITSAINELMAKNAPAPVVSKPKPQLYVKREKPQNKIQAEELHIVGIHIEPEAPGLMTADAESFCSGFVVYGPDASMSGLMPYEHFVAKLQLDKLTLKQRFYYNREIGKVFRGILMHDIENKHTCKTCGHTYFNLSFNKLNDLRRMQGVQYGAPYCQICLNKLNADYKAASMPLSATDAAIYAARKDKAHLAWSAAPAVRVGAGDLRARQLYAEYTKYVDNPIGSNVNVLPRVWAVYPADKAPGDWMPSDPVAQAIEAAEQKVNLTIRPFNMVNRDNAGALLALRMEATRSSDGKPGMAVGWMTAGMLGKNRVRGYTTQLVPNFRRLESARYRSNNTYSRGRKIGAA